MNLLGWLLRKRADDPLGRRGENVAAAYVSRTLAMRVLARNVRCPGGELDLVALDGPDLVFLEVRTRSSEAFGTPEASIRRDKRRFLVRSARWFIRTRRLHTLHPRFDVIAIVWPDGSAPAIRHHRGVFGFRG